MSKTALLIEIEQHSTAAGVALQVMAKACEDIMHMDFAKAKTSAATIKTHLDAIDVCATKFNAKIEKWKNPGFLKMAKNVLQQTKLDQARKDATGKFNGLKTEVASLKSDYEFLSRSLATAEEIYKKYH